MRASLVFVCAAALEIAAGRLHSQEMRFEVASVKLADPTAPKVALVTANAGMVRYSGTSLRECIRVAYRVRDFQVSGPEWMDSARFDISARLPPGSLSQQLPDMLRTLLAERFKLSIARVTKEQSVYALDIGKTGAKLKPVAPKLVAPSKDDNRTPDGLGVDGKPRPMMMFRYAPTGVILTAPVASLPNLVEIVSRFTERPILDMTGIEGQFDFNLNFFPERPPSGMNMPVTSPDQSAIASEPAPSLASAIRELGLQLEVRKVPVEMISVTHLEKTPSEN